jgi:hypothetical protein
MSDTPKPYEAPSVQEIENDDGPIDTVPGAVGSD